MATGCLLARFHSSWLRLQREQFIALLKKSTPLFITELYVLVANYLIDMSRQVFCVKWNTCNTLLILLEDDTLLWLNCLSGQESIFEAISTADHRNSFCIINIICTQKIKQYKRLKMFPRSLMWRKMFIKSFILSSVKCSEGLFLNKLTHFFLQCLTHTLTVKCKRV